MDTQTVTVSVLSSLVIGGLIGGLVSLVVARSESKDRRAALDLERARWNEEQRQVRRRDLGDLYVETGGILEDIGNRWSSRLDDDPGLGQLVGFEANLRDLAEQWAAAQQPGFAQELRGAAFSITKLRRVIENDDGTGVTPYGEFHEVRGRVRRTLARAQMALDKLYNHGEELGLDLDF